MCWAYTLDEGDLDELYWRLSFWEISKRIQLKMGELTAVTLCNYTGLAQVASMALGGGKRSATRGEDVTEGAQTAEQAIAAINAMLNFGG